MGKMNSRFRWIVFSIVVVAVDSGRSWSAPDVPAGPRMVMIIRHAEKPDGVDGKKDPDLSKRGFERADALAKVIPDHFPRPDFLIATRKSKGSNRPVETLTPLSEALHETIDSSFSSEAIDDVAHTVLTDPKYAGKTVLIAWHHGKIPDLAKALARRTFRTSGIRPFSIASGRSITKTGHQAGRICQSSAVAR